MKVRVVGFLMLIASVIALPAAPATQPDRSSESREISDRLDRMLPEVRFDAVGLSDVFDFLRDVSDANILVDWKSLEKAKIDHNAPISVSLKNKKFDDALQAILEVAGGGKGKVVSQNQGGLLIISTKDGMGPIVEALKSDVRNSDERTKTRLARLLPEVMFDGTALTDCLDFLSDVSGAKIDVDWDRFAKHDTDKNTPITMKLRHVPFGDAVRLIFFSATGGPVDITATEKGIHIAPIENAKKSEEKPAKP